MHVQVYVSEHISLGVVDALEVVDLYLDVHLVVVDVVDVVVVVDLDALVDVDLDVLAPVVDVQLHVDLDADRHVLDVPVVV